MPKKSPSRAMDLLPMWPEHWVTGCTYVWKVLSTVLLTLVPPKKKPRCLRVTLNNPEPSLKKIIPENSEG